MNSMRCLILHGLAGSPFEVRPVADALEAAGHVAVCPVLPGHAASEAEYLASSYAEWLDCVRAAYLDLCADGPVLLIGYSLGGLLALDMAAEAAQGRLPAPAGLLLLATPLFLWRMHPFFLADWRMPLLPLWNRLQPVRRVPPRSAASRAVAPWQGHETLCSYRQLQQLMQAQKRVRAALGNICVPLCAVQLCSDGVCPPFNASYLLEHCGSTDCCLHLLRVTNPHGGHLPTTHAESRERVAAIAAAFACEVAAGKACKIAPQRI